jgi:hypothetical protein
MCRVLHHKVDNFKLLFDWIFKLMHLIEIDGFTAWSGCISWKMAPITEMHEDASTND